MKPIGILTFMAVSYVTVAESAPQAESNELVSFGLNGFKNIYLTLVQNMAPIYNVTYNNFHYKVAEFQRMNGIQEFLSLSSLYAQYIPSYSVCNQQVNLQNNEFSKFGPDTYRGASNVLLTPSDLVTFNKSQQLFLAGDSVSIAGVVQTINAIQNAVASPDFRVNNDIIDLPGKLAVAIGNGIASIMAGNQDIIDGFNAVLNLNSSRIMGAQNNAQSVNFMRSLFIFWESAQKLYVGVKNNEEKVYSLFENASLSASFTIDISTFNNAVNSAYSNIATMFKEGNEADVVFEKAMASPFD